MSSLMQSSRFNTLHQRKNNLDTAYNACNTNGMVTVKDLADYAGVSEKTVRNWIKDFKHEYTNIRGTVQRISQNGANHKEDDLRGDDFDDDDCI